MTPELFDAALVVLIVGLIGWLARRVIRKQRKDLARGLMTEQHWRDWYLDEGGEG